MVGPRDTVAWSETDTKVDNIRSFNRFYTQRIGVLEEHMLDTPYSLTEARILFELGQRDDLTATDLARLLNLDTGYLSRNLSAFEMNKLITRLPASADRRKRLLALTPKGQSAFTDLVERAKDQIKAMLEGLGEESQNQVVEAMSTIQGILDPDAPKPTSVVIRSHRPGDIGWIVQRHGELYNLEYRWDETFEALVAAILGELVPMFDHRRDHIWIAEVGGVRAGCVVAARADDNILKLRLFLVEPWARGRGVGKQLVDEFIRFARQAGYQKITLWTQSVLTAARHIYEKAGFELKAEKPHHSFGHDLVAETWERELR